MVRLHGSGPGPRQPARSLVRAVRLALVGGSLAIGLAFASAAAAQETSPSPSAAASLAAGPSGPAGSGSFKPLPLETPVPLPSGAAASPGAVASPAPTPIVHPSDGKSNTCYDCHAKVNDQQAAIASQWKDSVHGQNGVGCADCHGGDPRSDEMGVAMSTAAGFIGKPGRTTTVGVCGSCHSDPNRMKQYGLSTDQYAQYMTSVHGQRLVTTGDTRVAICTDCHGVHDIKKASDPTAKVSPLNVPALCASCHADPKLMQPYGIPTDQYAIYKNSVHGQMLLVQQDVRAPTCASCHGSHGAKPPTDAEVVGVCGKCHTATEALYQESKHSTLAVGPKCWTCHGTHDVTQPGLQLFFHPNGVNFDCTVCHDTSELSSSGSSTASLKLQAPMFANPDDRRCDTCHHSGSDVYTQIQAIHDALQSAQDAYDQTEARIAQARSLGMIVADADVTLTQARTSLLKAQAAVHTTKLTSVAALTDDAKAKSASAMEIADAKLAESDFRREAMVVVVLVIGLNVGLLSLLKRRLHPSE
jgi:Cytochrome c3